MEAWLRQLALNAQLRTGLGAAVVMWGAAAVLGAALALIFLLIAAFVWLADRYDRRRGRIAAWRILRSPGCNCRYCLCHDPPRQHQARPPRAGTAQARACPAQP